MSGPGRHYLHVFATFTPGGPQVRAAMIMDRLPAPDRHTIVPMDEQTTAAPRVERARYEILPPPRERGFLRASRAMARRIRDLAPDLVLTYSWGAIETVRGCRLAGHRAVIHHEEGFGREEADRFLRRRILARRWLLRSTCAVVVPSRVLERVAREVWRQPPSRVRYLPNGVDLARFRPSARRTDSASQPPRDVVIGTVGHFRPEKNQAMLVEAFARCRNRDRARLVLVGDGPHLAETRDRSRVLGVEDRIRFAGPVADTSEIYADMDLFALSSRTEQMPLVVLEAMACGLAVVSPDVGDVKEMVSEENRPLVVAKDDPAALAAALDRAIADAELRLHLGRSNRRRCEERFDLERCLGAHLDLYREVLSGEPCDASTRREGR